MFAGIEYTDDAIVLACHFHPLEYTLSSQLDMYLVTGYISSWLERCMHIGWSWLGCIRGMLVVLDAL